MSNGSLLKPCTSWQTLKDIRYTNSSPGRAGLADIMVPNNGKGDNPAILWAHGGGWIGGDKGDYLTKLQPLVKAGFVVIPINYRLSSEAIWPAQIIDFKTAVRAVKANASLIRAWPGKIGVAGDSAGGHLAACMGTSNGLPAWDQGGEWPGVSSDVAAVLDDYGPSDLTAWVRLGLWPPPAVVVNLLLGGSVDQQPTRALDASPVHWVGPGDVPFYIRYGLNDNTVPPSQHIELRDTLIGYGVPVKELALAGAGHGDGAFYTASRLATVAAWFDQILRP